MLAGLQTYQPIRAMQAHLVGASCGGVSPEGESYVFDPTGKVITPGGRPACTTQSERARAQAADYLAITLSEP